MRFLTRQWLGFLSALGLMSRIPIGLFSGKNLSSEHHNYSQIWYPWVGAVLGVFFLLWYLVVPDAWSPFLASVVLVVIWVSFSGALHLDGLADSVDAWVGGMGDSGKTLAIMQDPASGPMAVVCLVLVLLLKVALVSEIIGSSQALASILIAVIPMLARAWLLPFLYKTRYVRQSNQQANQKKAMAADIAAAFPGKAALISFAMVQLVVFIVLLFLDWSLWVLLVMNAGALIVCFLIRTACVNRIGGYTGDVLGAFVELQEVALLLVLTVSMTLLI